MSPEKIDHKPRQLAAAGFFMTIGSSAGCMIVPAGLNIMIGEIF